MQLVNIESPKNLVSTNLISAIQSGDVTTAKNLIREDFDLSQILRSFYIIACRQNEINNHLISAMVYTDAIVEITKRLFPEDSEQIIQSALDYYCSLNYSDKVADLSSNDKIENNSPVVVSDLSESIASGDLDKSFNVARKLLAVIESKQYFNELLFEIASKLYSESGESIVVINSVCKGIKYFEWKMTEELIWFALNFLTSEKSKLDLQNISPSNKEIKYAEYVIKAASNPGEFGNNLIFMAHARQVYRSASVKYKEIWESLSSFIQKKLDNTSTVEMDIIEPVKGDMNDLERSFGVKDVQLTMTLVNQLMESGKTSADIFRSITLYMIQENYFAFPENVIYLNTARRLSAAFEFPRNLLIFKSYLEFLFKSINNI